MSDLKESKRLSLKNKLLIFIMVLLISEGLYALYKYKHFLVDREVSITTIEDEGFVRNESDIEDIKDEIKDVLQIKDEEVIFIPESRPEVSVSSNNSIGLAMKIDKLNERIELLESRLNEFTRIAINIPNYQQLIMTVIDLEDAIKKGSNFSSSILKINNITKDFYIISRINQISRANFLKLYGADNLQNEFNAALGKYDASLVLNNDDNSVWHKFLGDFIVIKKTGNFSGDTEDLIDQAEIFLREGHMARAIDNLKLLDADRYEFFKEFVEHSDHYLEALRLCSEIKGYLNL